MESQEKSVIGGAPIHPDLAEGGQGAQHLHHEVHVSVRLLPHGHEAKFHLAANAPLLDVLEAGAKHLDVHLLPPGRERPLDQFHDLSHCGQVGPAIDNLDQDLGPYLKEKGTTAHFGIKLVLAFRVNTALGSGDQARDDAQGDPGPAGNQPRLPAIHPVHAREQRSAAAR